jgi:hypothetical protein
VLVFTHGVSWVDGFNYGYVQMMPSTRWPCASM